MTPDPTFGKATIDADGPASPDPHDDEGPDGGHRRRMFRHRPPKKTLSQVLTEIAEDASREFIAINDLIVLLGGRGRAGLILLFAFPNVLPAPPGLSALLGLPLLYLSLQTMLGRMPWLPRFIGERAIKRDRFSQMVERLVPWLARAERLLRPRWSWLVGHWAEYVLGALCLILAAVLALPIPLGNMLPALAICLMALGVLERDGVWVLIGIIVGIGSLALVSGVVYALVKTTVFLLLNAFA